MGGESDLGINAGYEEFAGKLAAALREAIETDLSNAEERQVSPYTARIAGDLQLLFCRIPGKSLSNRPSN